MKKITITEYELNSLVHRILEQVEDDYYEISAEDYVSIMELGNYNGPAISKIKKFQGKPLYIIGDVDLRNTPTQSLGNVIYIDGSLVINNTKILDLGITKVKNHIWDSGTPRENKRIQDELRERKNQMNTMRIDGDWDFEKNENIDDEGLKANALFQSLVKHGDLNEMDEETKQRVDELTEKIKTLENNEEYNDDVQEEIDELQNELDEILSEDYDDVYVLSPKKYGYYGLITFEILKPKFYDRDWVVGTSDEIEEAAREAVKDRIDDMGLNAFNKGFVNYYIDEDSVLEWFKDMYEEDIYQNPEAYFDNDDYELTDEQESRIEEIEQEIDMYEKEQNDLDINREDYDEIYDDFQSLIDDLESEKESIVPDTDNLTEDMVQNKIDDLIENVSRNITHYMEEFGLNIEDYIDMDELIQGVIDQDGYGTALNSYDSSYDEEKFNDEWYYIMRIN